MPVYHEGDLTILGTASAQPIARARSNALLLWGAGIIVFLANCAILVLQLVAGRLLSPYIGMSLATWTAIIGVFMLGISLGNWVGGRVADRWPGARTLSLLLLIGSLSTLATLGLIALLGVGDGAVARPLPLYPRIALLTLLLCFPPSFVLSMITPLAIKVTAARRAPRRQRRRPDLRPRHARQPGRQLPDRLRPHPGAADQRHRPGGGCAVAGVGRAGLGGRAERGGGAGSARRPPHPLRQRDVGDGLPRLPRSPASPLPPSPCRPRAPSCSRRASARC